MRVRKFQKRDARQVSILMRAAFRSFLAERFTRDCEDQLSPPILAKNSAARTRFSETASFVAIDGSRVVGYVQVTAGRNGLGALQLIGVHPDYFGRGAGALLMNAAEALWVRKKQRKIATCVSTINRRALIYYIKHGFVPEGCCRDHFIPGVDEIILGRFLHGPFRSRAPSQRQNHNAVDRPVIDLSRCREATCSLVVRRKRRA